MYELIQINENDYYFDCPAKIGLVKTDERRVVLIDSGNDKDAGKKVLRVLESNGWELTAIFNTHSHADHIGGNHFLEEKTGCRIYTGGMETAYTKHPLLEPVGLYGGLPVPELKQKFLMAQPSAAEALTESVLPVGMTVLPLGGHSADMVGFLTKDGTAYVADCLSSAETLEKYGIGYLFDPETARNTLAYVKTVKANCFVPSHAAVTEDITAIADQNIAAIDRVFETVLSLCTEAISFESLLKKMFDAYEMRASAQQFALIGSTLRAYLTNLFQQGLVAYSFEDNRMLWKKV